MLEPPLLARVWRLSFLFRGFVDLQFGVSGDATSQMGFRRGSLPSVVATVVARSTPTVSAVASFSTQHVSRRPSSSRSEEGQRRGVRRDQVWPRPSLARPSLAKTKFGQDQVWPDQVRDNQYSPCFTQTRLMSAFRFNGPLCGASPAEGPMLHMKVC